ncbi:MAG: hypothetical protein U0401_21260 [Anaerolineae bacterium]
MAEAWRTRLSKPRPGLSGGCGSKAICPYRRRGSLAPHYERLTCAIFSIGGWADGYTNAVLRMQER